MKFKIDQNLAVECAVLLAEAGHDAMTVYQQELTGAPDERIVTVCQQEERVLITADLDLSDIRRYPPGQSAGFIVLRLREQNQPNQLALLRKILPMFETTPLAGHLWIVDVNKVRVRQGV
jgi:predicted nuclease of predicted toxin-antitoxin system